MPPGNHKGESDVARVGALASNVKQTQCTVSVDGVDSMSVLRTLRALFRFSAFQVKVLEFHKTPGCRVGLYRGEK